MQSKHEHEGEEAKRKKKGVNYSINTDAMLTFSVKDVKSLMVILLYKRLMFLLSSRGSEYCKSHILVWCINYEMFQLLTFARIISNRSAAKKEKVAQ